MEQLVVLVLSLQSKPDRHNTVVSSSCSRSSLRLPINSINVRLSLSQSVKQTRTRLHTRAGDTNSLKARAFRIVDQTYRRDLFSSVALFVSLARH